MSLHWELEARRLARLARLELREDEVRGLAEACEAITRDFSALADLARGLPAAPDLAAGELRADDAAPASSAEVAAILQAVPKLDAASRCIRAPRGLP